MEDLFREFWWLMFPVFGMAMAIIQMVQDNRRAGDVIARARRALGDK